MKFLKQQINLKKKRLKKLQDNKQKNKYPLEFLNFLNLFFLNFKKNEKRLVKLAKEKYQPRVQDLTTEGLSSNSNINDLFIYLFFSNL